MSNPDHGTVRYTFQQLSGDNRARARASFLGAGQGDGYVYALKADGSLLSRKNRSRLKRGELLVCAYSQCCKPIPARYGEPGASTSRVDSRTQICSECGTREALAGCRLMKLHGGDKFHQAVLLPLVLES